MSDPGLGHAGLRLESIELRLRRQPGALVPQIEAALRRHGRPLRWAITAVGSPSPTGAAAAAGPTPGPAAGPQTELLIEAVVLT